MKYRIIKEYGLYYPQVKWLFWWRPTTGTGSCCSTLEEALEGVEQHKKIFSKVNKGDVVWRSW